MKNSNIKLTLPVEISYIELIAATVEYMALRRGFTRKEINKINIGVEEAVTNVIQHAFEEAENETFDLIISIDETGIKIIIKEKGEPFDPEQIKEYNVQNIEEEEAKGLGLFLMKKSLDEVAFYNLGNEGKETHLIKYFPYKSIDTFKEFKKDDFEVENDKKQEKKDFKFSIRLMKPEEAIEVSKCAYSAYGYSYLNHDIYFPEKIRDYNNSGKMISIVAVLDDNNEMIGHTALKPDSLDNVAEVGVSFIKPKFRGGGCFNKLEQARIDEALKHNFAGLYSQAVTTHPFSQKAAHKYGFCDCALLIIRLPMLEFKKIICPVQQSILEIFTDIYGGAVIYIKQYGNDIIEKIKQLKKNICMDKFDVIFLYLNTSDPFTAFFFDEFEKLDFIFVGIMPGTLNKTTIILQFINNHRVDFDYIKTDSEMGGILKDYIKKNL